MGWGRTRQGPAHSLVMVSYAIFAGRQTTQLEARDVRTRDIAKEARSIDGRRRKGKGIHGRALQLAEGPRRKAMRCG